MAINNFIPQVWSARLMENLRNTLIYAQPGVVNRDYEGEIEGQGSSVRINAIGKVNVGDYGKNSNIPDPDELGDAGQVLTIDKSRFFNFQVDDIDKIQQRPKIMDQAMAEAAYALTNDMDAYVAAKFATEGGVALGTDGVPYVVGMGGSDKNAYEVLVDISVALDEANTPETGRWVGVPPWFYGLLLKDQRFVSFGTDNNSRTLRNGEIGMAANLMVLRSNNVPNASGKFKIVASHAMACTVAAQTNQVEAYRPEKRFADAVKGLMLYGAKVIRPSNVVVLTAQKGS